MSILTSNLLTHNQSIKYPYLSIFLHLFDFKTSWSPPFPVFGFSSKLLIKCLAESQDAHAHHPIGSNFPWSVRWSEAYPVDSSWWLSPHRQWSWSSSCDSAGRSQIRVLHFLYLGYRGFLTIIVPLCSFVCVKMNFLLHNLTVSW